MDSSDENSVRALQQCSATAMTVIIYLLLIDAAKAVEPVVDLKEKDERFYLRYKPVMFQPPSKSFKCLMLLRDRSICGLRRGAELQS